MLKAESLKKYIDEVIAEIEQELDEATTTGDIAGYETPNAFSDGSDATKRRKKKIATQLGMQLVGKVESVNEASTSFVSGNSGRTITNLDNKKYQLTKDVKGAQIGNYTNVVLPKGSIIYNLPGGVFASHPSLKDKFSGIKETPKFGFRVTTHSDTILTIEKSSKILESISEMVITEKQFKGLDGIPATTSLAKITKDQKLKIIKGVGNIIDFVVPKGVSRNFWQVIGTGKVKKNLSGEYYLEGKMINSPMFKSMDDLINGVKWDSMEERRRFNESINEYNLNDIIKQVKTYEKPKDAKLLTIKVINKLKDTRNKSNSSKKSEIQKIIDTIEDDYNKGKYLKLESVNEDKRANILNIDFTITEKGDNIFFAFKDKKEGIIKIRKIGSNKIVNFIQDVLDKTYGKGSYFFKSGKNAEFIGGYEFGRNPNNNNIDKLKFESINENRWLELKNDDSMHANKKLAVGLKELKNQLSEVEKFFRWYNQIKTMNELDSNQYWKRTNSHIYKIKERIINIARTLQEIEK